MQTELAGDIPEPSETTKHRDMVEIGTETPMARTEKAPIYNEDRVAKIAQKISKLNTTLL